MTNLSAAIIEPMRYTTPAPLRRRAMVALAAVLLAAPACRTGTDIACSDAALTVTVGASNNVVPNTASVAVRTVSRPGGPLPSATRVQSITIRPADIQFTGTGTGTIAVALAINGYLSTVGAVSISNGTVTGFTPATHAPGQFGREEARALLTTMPEQQRAALNLQNLDALSDAQIQDAVSAAVRDGAFVLAMMSRAEGGVQGSINLRQIVLNVGC
jgi:hypothetical protein